MPGSPLKREIDIRDEYLELITDGVKRWRCVAKVQCASP